MVVVPEFHSKTRATREERLLERYIGALGLHSIFVGAPEAQFPAKIGHNAEVVGRSSGGKFIIWEREWCGSPQQAHAVVGEVLSRLQSHRTGTPGNGWVGVDVYRAHLAVHEAADALKIPLTANQRLQDRGRLFLDRAEQKIFSMRRDGSLRAVNKAFKAQRVEAQSKGRKMPNYQEFLDAYLHDFFELIARQVFGAAA